MRKFLGISKEHLYQLGFPTTLLDTIPTADLVSIISDVFKSFEADELFLPHLGDIHSLHSITFEAASACSKWFRYPSLKRILAYETLSETDFGIDPSKFGFLSNFFVDVSAYSESKPELLNFYSSELGEPPFPRSNSTVSALAQVRSAQAGFDFAEGFMLLRERS